MKNYYVLGITLKVVRKYRVRQINFFLENALKKTIFSNFFFYLKVQSLWLIKENNFIQMAFLTKHAVAYTIDQIFKHIIDYVQLYSRILLASRILSFKASIVSGLWA